MVARMAGANSATVDQKAKSLDSVMGQIEK
jgi:recombination protein RecA